MGPCAPGRDARPVGGDELGGHAGVAHPERLPPEHDPHALAEGRDGIGRDVVRPDGRREPPKLGGDFVEHLKDLASEAPVIRLVNTIIGRVIDLRASDIHLEPFDDGLHVRYRVDGVIHPGGWCDVGQPESIAMAEQLLTAGGVA